MEDIIRGEVVEVVKTTVEMIDVTIGGKIDAMIDVMIDAMIDGMIDVVIVDEVVAVDLIT